MKRLLVATALVGLLAAPAGAQETYNWTGLYFGAHGGYAWSDIDYPEENPYVAPPASCGGAFPDSPLGKTWCGPPRASLEGGILGGQIGYNVQLGKIVLGAEVDYAFANLSESVRDGNYLEQTHEIDGLASVRGRVGYAFGNFLPYVTGGWGWANASIGQSCPVSAAVVAGHCKTADKYDLSDGKWIDGWVLGGGVEYAINKNWSLKAEYLHYDFGENDFELGTAPSGVVIPTKTTEQDVDVMKIGVNYKFGN